MKLDVSALRYLQPDDLRVLTAVEMGMKNHELVPIPLITNISSLRFGGVEKSLRELHKHKLLHHEQRGYDGYRLTYMGYDYLGLAALSKRGSVVRVGNRLGVGKEADVFHGENEQGEVVVIKIHRLGRTSFRAVKDKRDYHRHRQSASWLYLSRLAATREYAFMQALYDHDFPVPEPLDSSRHIVVMGLVDGYPLTQVKQLGNPAKVCNELVDIAIRLAEVGLVHCDLNEFNVLIDDEEKITVIDFPQMVSTSHADANELFERDVQSLYKFFRHRFGLDEEIQIADYSKIEAVNPLDAQLEASGFHLGGAEDIHQALDTLRKQEKGEAELSTFSSDVLNSSAAEDVHQDNAGMHVYDAAHRSSASEDDANAYLEPSEILEVVSQRDAEQHNGPEVEHDFVGERSKDTADGDQQKPRRPEADNDLEQDVDAHDQDPDTATTTTAAVSNVAQITTRMSRAMVAEKVRKQREKRDRRQTNRRNVSKSEAKRKARSELATSSFWDGC